MPKSPDRIAVQVQLWQLPEDVEWHHAAADLFDTCIMPLSTWRPGGNHNNAVSLTKLACISAVQLI